MITEQFVKNKTQYIKYIKENGAEGECPWWCIQNFVELPSDIVDAEGQPIIGATLQLSYDDSIGRTFPGPIYKRREIPLYRRSFARRMNRESLFEGAQLFCPQTIDELLNQA